MLEGQPTALFRHTQKKHSNSRDHGTIVVVLALGAAVIPVAGITADTTVVPDILAPVLCVAARA